MDNICDELINQQSDELRKYINNLIIIKKKKPVVAVLKSDAYPESDFLTEQKYAETFGIVYERVPFSESENISEENLFISITRILNDDKICAIISRITKKQNILFTTIAINFKILKDVSGLPKTSMIYDWFINDKSLLYVPEIFSIGIIMNYFLKDIKNKKILFYEDLLAKNNLLEDTNFLLSTYLSKKIKGDYTLIISKSKEYLEQNLDLADVIILNNLEKLDLTGAKENSIVIEMNNIKNKLPEGKNIKLVNYSDFKKITQISLFKNIAEVFKISN